MSVEGPPLTLTAEVEDAEGVRTLWSPSGRAEDRPRGVTFGTIRGDGFGTCSLTLPRRADRDYPDLGLYDTIRLIGEDGEVAYEGQVAGFPRSIESHHEITVEAVGWMAHARDDEMALVVVDRDVSHWEEVGLDVKLALLDSGGFRVEGPQTGTDETTGLQTLKIAHSGGWNTAAQKGRVHVVGAYTFPRPQNGELYYSYQRGDTIAGSEASRWPLTIRRAQVVNTSGSELANLSEDSGSGTVTMGAEQDQLRIRLIGPSSPEGDTNAEYGADFTVAVYGDHGMPKRTSATAPIPGFYASDVIRHIIDTHCPKLSAAGVQDTAFIIEHLEWRDGIAPYDAIKQVNEFHRWNLSVFENRTLHFGPADLTQADWVVRTDDQNVTIKLQGDTIDDVANGVTVHYTDFAGRQHRLHPDDYDELRDPNPNLAANRHGRKIYPVHTVPFPCSLEGAIQVGRAILRDLARPKAAGTITVRGHIRDAAGNWQQGWKVREGQTIAIADFQNNSPRLIHETRWDDESKTLTISVDGVGRLMEVFFARAAKRLEAVGLR